ncbi:MAG: hypothetical protein KF884_08585 [Fimbriimonadaceae bacterium]|nr:hypothetical protein [Fimbriimonadaceae bacterium]QYK57606.1 MAG: hypothetical protein KF884_08585 [Fimbriimonadaceae bacterium]
MAVTWEATDQFGNLFVGKSDARDVEALRSDLTDLCQAVFERADEVIFAIDVPYAEVSGPKGDQVTHVLQVPWFAERRQAGEASSQIQDEVAACLSDVAAPFGGATVQGPWDG